MARDNGGIIGPANNPTSSTASGVWDLPAQYQAISGGNWPPIPSIAENSLRFNDGSTDYLSRTPASASNRKTWTFSAWVKLASSFTSDRNIFGAGDDGDNQTFIVFQDTQSILFSYELANVRYLINTSAVFRDVSAWYHIVLGVDTTQATNTNRVKLYINGVQQTFNTVLNGFPPQNADTFVNNTSVHNVGYGSWNSFNPYDGYMSEVILVDGQQLEPTSFGQFNANGIWTPIPIALSFGTNGFHLKFENSASLGLDSSPNGNNFTVNNLTSIDQSTDIPTNNFATLNPLSQGATTTNRAYSNGNLSVTYNNGDDSSLTTMGVSTGKWYAEFKVTAQPTTATVGVGNEQSTFVVDPGNCNIGASTGAYGYFSTGQKRINGGGLTSYGSSYTTNDIIGIALNLDIGAIWFSKNGTWQASATITEIQNGTTTNAAATGLSGTFFLGTSNSASGTTGVAFDNNFGNPPFTIASGNSDGNGYGNFEYTVPSGYYALCTKNLAEFG